MSTTPQDTPSPGPFKRTRKRFRVVRPVGVEAEFFSDLSVKNIAERDQLETVDIAYCASCQKVMHNLEQAGGICAVCDSLVCLECSGQRCQLCGRCVCGDETTVVQGKPICQTHGFFETLRFALFGR